jgi:hypothetical protein
MEKTSELRVLSGGQAARQGLNRREMVQRLLGGAGAGFAFPAVASSSHPIHKHLASPSTLDQADAKSGAADWAPEFLDPHQNETLTVLAERIVPGSTKAQVNRFIDLLLTVDTQENQKKFLASLGAFEAEAINRFAHPFNDLTEEQQNQILTVASTEKPGRPEGSSDWSWFAVPSKGSSETETPRVTIRDHFENIKGWVSGAYYSSEVGMRELGWTGDVYFDRFPGCEHPDGHK